MLRELQVADHLGIEQADRVARRRGAGARLEVPGGPAPARCAAHVSPLCPPPMMTASKFAEAVVMAATRSRSGPTGSLTGRSVVVQPPGGDGKTGVDVWEPAGDPR